MQWKCILFYNSLSVYGICCLKNNKQNKVLVALKTIYIRIIIEFINTVTRSIYIYIYVINK